MRLAQPVRSLPLRLALIAVLVAAALVVALARPGQAPAARGLELAIQDDPVFLSESYFGREKGFKYLRSIGVTRIRVNILWAYTMPESQYKARRKPATINWNFAGYDDLVDAAAAQGIRIHASLTGPAPVWASGDHRLQGGVRPNTKYFGQFAAVVSQHFKGRIDRYSIWNEPNWKTWLQPLKKAPSIYRSMYTRSYKAIKAADPAAKVLIGETSPYARRGLSTAPIAFLRSLACVNKKYKRVRRCTPLKADGYAHHPYDFGHSPDFQYPGADNVTIGTLPRLTRALDKLSRSGALRYTRRGKMPIYLTEYGYFASGHRALPKKLRPKYLQRAYDIALRNPRVKSQLQFLLVSPPRLSDQAFFNTAIVSQRGKRYPQYSALQRWFRKNRGKVKRASGAIGLPPAQPQPTS